MKITRTAGPLVQPVELDPDDELEFELFNGETRVIKLVRTGCGVVSTDVDELQKEKPGAITVYRFFCTITINGVQVELQREVGTDRSFYTPREVMGVRIWFDAVDDIFEEIVTETHGPCRPEKQARFVIQDACAERICPVRLHPWCRLPKQGLKIHLCYNGDDCWLGAYFGASAHGGLDINMDAGSLLWTPLSFDDQFLYNTLENGDNNNRWRGVHRWPDGTEWHLSVCHIIRLLVDEHVPLEAGVTLAETAGVRIGAHEHSHFVFTIVEDNREYRIDPWILFQQMYADLEDAYRIM